MLLIRNNAPLKFEYTDFEYFKSLRNTRNPNNKSNIIVINFTNEDLGRAVSHRDVYHIDELKTDLIKKGIDAMNIDYIKFMILFCVDPGTPVLGHIHKTENHLENHFQPVIGLSPNNNINGVVVGNTSYDLTGHNSILLNVKLPHYVEAQKDPNIWLTSFCARIK